MYIQPNGTVLVLHNIPLDNTYQHTLRFSSLTTQYNYFSAASRVKRTFTNQYYTRLNRGVIRVNELADNLYDCNYIAYQNTSFGNKWFYAFIKSVEYVNNAVTEIQFELDVIQTWYFDFDLQPCFIDRMHSTTDGIGENIVAEPVEIGERVYNRDSQFAKVFNQSLYIILSIVDTQEQSTLGHDYGRVYSGTTLWVFNSSDIDGINAKIAEFMTRPDAIVNMYMCPTQLILALVDDGGVELTEDYVLTTPTGIEVAQALTAQTPLNGYIPRNKKLYTYPFTSLEISTPAGGKLETRYEFFTNGTPIFALFGSVNMPVELTLSPANYKNTGNNLTGGCINECLSLTNYPICSWNTDTYKAWVAQNSVPMALDVISSGTMLAGAAANGALGVFAALRAGEKIIDTATGIVKDAYKNSIAADQLHGKTTGSSAISAEVETFWKGTLVPNDNQMRIIDSFFDMFGYAQKRVMQPVRKARRIWTYLKTVGCVLDGSVPAEDANKICRIHDSGITYWDVESNPTVKVGNYLLAAQNTVIE